LVSIFNILKQYWGYEAFRPLQEDIILSVLNGKDTLALLPTGGGKSICFQVPAMAKDGICIVVSPLIALMKDQVENLKQKDIKAAAVYSGMTYREINYTLDNCIHGDFKFLYVSPERLKSDLFRERLKQMDVNLLAIDEAHCISQWGYDFRPEYLDIAEVRELLPKDTPVLALTASATTKVVVDIQEKLRFKKQNFFLKSFERTNISYVINETEDKLNRLIHIINKVSGTGLVYVRNRKQTQEIAQVLANHHIKADFYHAGLTHQQRNKKQEDWIQNRTRIMVCTNAFGMGIDKPDVRLVAHIEPPESLESYYQEAGRAGRDEKRSYCVLLYNPADKHQALEKLNLSYPDKEILIKTYQSICNYYSIPLGEVSDRTYDLQLNDLCEKFKLKPIETYNSLKVLEQCSLIQLTESFFEPSRVRMLCNMNMLYKFQVEHPAYDPFIKLLLRSYAGLFDNYVRIDEDLLAKRSKSKKEIIIKYLDKLHQIQLLEYLPQKDLPQVGFVDRRIPLDELGMALKQVQVRKQTAIEKLNAMIDYAENIAMCRSKKLVAYFNEYGGTDCGVCDICISQKKTGLTSERFQLLIGLIQNICTEKEPTVKELTAAIKQFKAAEITDTVSFLLDNDKLQYNTAKQLKWKM